MPIRLHLFARLLIALLLVALLPLAIYWQVEHRRMLREGGNEAHEQLQLFSDRVTQQIDDWARLNLSIMQVAAGQEPMRSMDPAAQRAAIIALMPQLPWAYLIHTVDLRGINVARSDAAPATSYADRAYFRQILAGQPYAVEVQIGRTSHLPAFLLAVPIMSRQGVLRGLLIEAATLDQVTDAVTSARLGNTGYAMLIAPDGSVIADASHPQSTELRSYARHPAFLDAQRGDGLYRYTIDGVRSIALVRHTQLGWIAVAQQAIADNLAAARQANHNALLLLAVTAALVALISAFVARHLAAPIGRATRAALAISRGQLDFDVHTTRTDEIGDLMRAMHGVRQTIRGFLDTQRRMTAAAARGDFSERGDETVFHDAYADMVRQLNTLMQTVDREFTDLGRVLASIAQGDLSVSVTGNYEGTFATLQRDVNATIRALSSSIQQIELHRNLLRATLEHLPQGISVVDSELRVIAWNRRYEEIFAYPPGLLQRGAPVRALMEHNARRGLMGSGDAQALIERRFAQLRRGVPYGSERVLPNGTVLEIRGNAVPGIGYVTSFSDVTVYKRTELALRTMTESLERYVEERTRDLQLAKAEAEHANRSKTRFVAAAVHDLMQPLNAARLFASAARTRLGESAAGDLLDGLERALEAEDAILASLLDISRLESGAFEVRERVFALGPLLEALAAEFGIQARSRGIEFRWVPCRCAVRSDEALLRRILQNFLSNALQYTPQGRVLFGCRRVGADLRIEVWDTGPGIPQQDRERIFHEFERLDTRGPSAERRAGLGLAIVQRIGRRLNHAIELRSRVGSGSVFSVRVPRAAPAALSDPSPQSSTPASAPDDSRLRARSVWCLDDDPQALEAARALLQSWGCEVTATATPAEAIERAARSAPPDMLLLDYRLGSTFGPDVVPALFAAWHAPVPVIVITAEPDPAVQRAILDRDWGFLPKPVRPGKLRALMTRLLAPRRQPG